MRSSKVLGLVLVVGALLAPALVMAQAPAQMPMQGYLTDATGAPVDGSRAMMFRIFTTETGGTALFTESQSVMVDAGYFTAYMGDVSSLDLTIFRDNSLLYAEVEVGGEVLTPRMQLATVPWAAYADYAGTAGDAATVGGLASSAFAPTTHGHGWTDLTGVPADLSDGDADTTYTAGSGLTLTGTTFALDATGIQTRVSGTCPAGQSIRAIAADGSVICEVDDSGGVYTAGSGLTLIGTTFSVNATAVQARVTGACPAGSSIRVIAQNGTVTCEADDNSGGDITGVTAGSGLTGGGSSGTVTLNGSRFAEDTSGATTYLTTSCQNYSGAVVTITTTGPGRVIVEGSAWMQLYHTAGTADLLQLGIGATATDCGTVYNSVYYEIPAAWPTASNIDRTLTVRRSFAVSAAGTYSYYLNARMSSGYAASTDRFWYATTQATYIPN